jgi:hypothetical protein
MTTTGSGAEKHPTARQLAYLKALAERTGQTFMYPRTRGQASGEIARLKRTAPATRAERTLERIEDPAVREALEDAAAIQGFEIVGYGSSATWRGRS